MMIEEENVGADAVVQSATFPEVLEIHSILYRGSDEVYFVDMTTTVPPSETETERLVYLLGPTDPHGMAPVIRALVVQWIADGNPVGVFVPPPPPPITIQVGPIWTRMNDDEAEQFDDAMMAKPLRVRRQYLAEQSVYTEGTELYDAVVSTMHSLFQQERATQILHG